MRNTGHMDCNRLSWNLAFPGPCALVQYSHVVNPLKEKTTADDWSNLSLLPKTFLISIDELEVDVATFVPVNRELYHSDPVFRGSAEILLVSATRK